jgi:hypothetical protein
LIVPDEIERYGSIDELAEVGYSIIILCDRGFMLERKLPNSVNQTIAEHFLRKGKSRDDFYQGVKFEFQEASSDSFLMDVGNVTHKNAVLQNINPIMIRHLENLMSKLHGVSCYRVRKSIASSLKFIYFLNLLVYEQLRLAQLMRDHGLISWFYQMQEHSQNVYVSHLRGNVSTGTERVPSYISNMNLVPVYSVWLALNFVGLVALIVEIICNCEWYFARTWILLAWWKTRNNCIVRSLKLLRRMILKSIHDFVIWFDLFKSSPFGQLHLDMNRVLKKIARK